MKLRISSQSCLHFIEEHKENGLFRRQATREIPLDAPADARVCVEKTMRLLENLQRKYGGMEVLLTVPLNSIGDGAHSLPACERLV